MRTSAKILSLLLALVMLLSVLPGLAFAEGTEEPAAEEKSQPAEEKIEPIEEKEAYYKIKIEAQNCSVKLKTFSTEKGYEAGQKIQFTIDLDEGCVFEKDNPLIIPTVTKAFAPTAEAKPNLYCFVMPDSDVTIRARAVKNEQKVFPVRIDQINCTVKILTKSDSMESKGYAPGTKIEFTVSPKNAEFLGKSDLKILTESGDNIYPERGKDLDDAQLYYFTMPKEACTIHAKNSSVTPGETYYKIKIDAKNSTVKIMTFSTEKGYQAGQKIQFTIDLDEGCVFEKDNPLIIPTVTKAFAPTAEAKPNLFCFVMPDSDVTIRSHAVKSEHKIFPVYIEQINCKVTITSKPYAPGEPLQFAPGAKVEFTVSPKNAEFLGKSDLKILTKSGDNIYPERAEDTEDAQVYFFTMPKEACTIHAKNSSGTPGTPGGSYYKINIDAKNTTVKLMTFSTEKGYQAGQKIQFTIDLDEGFVFDKDNPLIIPTVTKAFAPTAEAKPNLYCFVMPDSDVTIRAHAVKSEHEIFPVYIDQINCKVTITSKPYAPGEPLQFAPGAKVEFTVSPKNAEFLGKSDLKILTKSGDNIYPERAEDTEDAQVYFFTMPKEACTIHANATLPGPVYTSKCDAEWTKGSNKPFVITVTRDPDNEACFSHFSGSVKIDDVELKQGTDFDAKSGSTIITIKPAALEKLKSGTHTIKASFDDGEATATVTLRDASGTSASKTGDDSVLGVWAALMAVSGILACALLIGKRRYGRR